MAGAWIDSKMMTVEYDNKEKVWGTIQTKYA